MLVIIINPQPAEKLAGERGQQPGGPGLPIHTINSEPMNRFTLSLH